MFLLISKRKYELLCKNNERLECKNIELNKKIENNKIVIDNLKLYKSKYEDIIVNCDKEINKLKQECSLKELQRRKTSGKLGNYKRKMNNLVAEKEEMIELINNLIDERQQMMKLRKKPTVDELRKYFKKH